MNEEDKKSRMIPMDEVIMADGEKILWSSLYTAYYMKTPKTGTERVISAAKAAFSAIMMLRGATAGYSFTGGEDVSWHAMAEQMLGVAHGKLSIYEGIDDGYSVQLDRMAAYQCGECDKRFGHDETAGEAVCPYCGHQNLTINKIRIVNCNSCSHKYEGRFGIPRSVCPVCGEITITGKLMRGGPTYNVNEQ